VTEPNRPGLKPGHWVLIGIVALLGILMVVVVVRHSSPRPLAEARPTIPIGTPAAPPCFPAVAEIGYMRTGGRIDFGLIAESQCSVAAVNNVIEVTAVRKDGERIEASRSQLLEPPVLLPGQRLGVSGTLLVDRSEDVARLEARFNNTQVLPLVAFAAWAKSVTVTDLRHTGPDSRGLSTVTGTIRTDPPDTSLCSPRFHLILRDKSNKIIYGMSAKGSRPTFEESFPAATDYSKAEVYVVQGSFSLALNVLADVACQGR
jgi:hypothetical protein